MQKISMLLNQHFTVIIIHLVAFLLMVLTKQNVIAAGTGKAKQMLQKRSHFYHVYTMEQKSRKSS